MQVAVSPLGLEVQAEPAQCTYCGMIDCRMPGHAGEVVVSMGSDSSAPMMVHPGIPLGMATAGVVMTILLTHIILVFMQRRGNQRGARFDLLQLPILARLVKRRGFPLALQAIPIALFGLVIVAGLFGSQRIYPASNIAPVLTWTIWWALLVFLVLCAGSAFCAICPWEGLQSLLTSLSLRSRKNRMGAELQWPKWLRNVYPAMAMFVLLTWFELGFDLTKSPLRTALMALFFVVMALCTALFFERRSFCRYLCLVGRVQGMYSLFAPVEVRARDFDVCRRCAGKECYNGTDKDVGCPTFLFPGALTESTNCTLCTECIRSCPEDNMTINLRPFASGLGPTKRFRMDEAIFAVLLLALTSFHGLTMTPSWTSLRWKLELALGVEKNVAFTLLMLAMMLWPVGLFFLAARLARWSSAVPNVSTFQVFCAFGYSVLPIALFYHLAHNGMHFFMEAQHLLPVLSDPFGWGWDLFGTARKSYPPILSLRTIWWLQLCLIVIGHVYSVVVSDRIARSVYTDPVTGRKAGLRALVPLIATMVLYSSFSIWLIAQPMEMRSGM